ncbi:unnamed protein product [Acanthoscelides obtectus]|uniref:Uncharacterized protein n=1 Tax=Acanthoscelides obtectus TaxID=200917 RepID=A0A9P0KTV3_ACAOB|nr:unnamed protein product [Acanthoscelides obtectus]CAK1651160.1 hypothetical protein AOBTE_LOCUS17099 [Acanthoscelides obtectus]
MKRDGATCHTAYETLSVLQQFAPGQVISRFGDQNWPPRSCGLTPLEFWPWGYLKTLVYANKPATTEAVKAEIRRCISDMCSKMLPQILLEECGVVAAIYLICCFIRNAKVYTP